MSSGNSACGILHVSVTSNGVFFGSDTSRVGLSTHVSDSLISVLVTPCQCRTFPVSGTHFMDSSFLVCVGHSSCQVLTSWIRHLSDTSCVGHSPCQVLTSWIRLFSDTSCVGHSLCQIRPLPDKTNFLVNLYGTVNIMILILILILIPPLSDCARFPA